MRAAITTPPRPLLAAPRPARVPAPADCPREIVAKLQGEVLLALANPQVRERIAALGLEPVGSAPAEFGLFVQAEFKKYAEMVRAAGIQPE